MRDSLEFETMPTGAPIHGDFNTSNVHISKNGLNNIKLVDWEWAGLGLPLMDLASLLKRTKPEVEKQGLAIYSKHDFSLSPSTLKRFYYWCKLERGILDASFIAVQLLDSQTTTTFSLEKFVEESLQQVLTAFQKMAP
jgi:thiamine kinase-like enzyme